MDGRSPSKDTAIWTRLLRGEENDEEVNQLLAQFHDENALQLNLNSHIKKNPLNLPSGKNFADLDHAGLDKELAMRYAKLKAPAPYNELSKNNKTPPAKKEIGDLPRNDDIKKVMTEEERENSGLEKGSNQEESKNQDSRVIVLVDEEEKKILGQELAARFAALKTINSSEGQGLAEVSGGQGFDPQEEAPAAQLGIGKEESTEACSEAEEVQRLLASVQDSIKLEKTRVSGAARDDEKVDNGEDEEISDSEVDKVVEWAKDAARLGLLESEEEEDDNDEDIVDEDILDEGLEKNTGRNSKK